jgi:hypothetical protein
LRGTVIASITCPQQAQALCKGKGTPMVTETGKAKSSNGQHRHDTGSGKVLACQPKVASGGSLRSQEQDICWTDRFAFKFWLACFALLALMVAYDAITGVLRWIGSK